MRNHIEIDDALVQQLQQEKSLILPSTEKAKTEEGPSQPVDSDLKLKTELLAKIGDYLHWCDHKHVKDTKRGYKVGLFTDILHRHSGKLRAYRLQDELSKCDSVQELMDKLQQHFRKNSSLNNHSLDTYLLEGIRDTDLFDIKSNPLSTKKERKIYLNEVLHLENTSLSFKM